MRAVKFAEKGKYEICIHSVRNIHYYNCFIYMLNDEQIFFKVSNSKEHTQILASPKMSTGKVH